ncbi:MAG: c-type cytochrome [Candidatus Acidiferrum sp.]
MAHSLRRASQEPDGVVNENGSKITIHSSPSGYWQSWENGGDRNDYRVDFVIGSGNHASGYLVDIGGHLFQSPVAYYTARHAYDLAPGYENVRDPDFTRAVAEGCVLCHSGTALHVPGTLNEYRSSIFPEAAITCERCHGPVEKHLADPRAGTIINPAKLEPVARDSVCEQCHLFGAARVLNPGKEFSDYMPGQRLEDTYTTYHNAVPPGSPAGAFKVISQAEQLALSACARNSRGKLWCGTCHDPHDKPLQPVAYYRTRCLSCHTGNFPASHPNTESNCIGCHMPRRDAKDGGHTAFTDHRIQRRPETRPDLPADTGIVAWREPAPELQKRNLGIAYIDVGMQRHLSSFIIQGYRTLTEVQKQFEDDSDLFKWIGEALILGRQTSDAKFAFERALQLNPDSPLAEADAASPFIQEGDTNAAVSHLERAVSLDPLDLPAASTLIDLYQKQGKTEQAGALASRIKLAMNTGPDAGRNAEHGFSEFYGKKTEDVFKNIQVLKDIPASQLIPAMEFISSSLGVECSFCHVEGHFEKDDKKPKRTARAMMQMMFALNKNNFEGKREVTCYSCHRGSSDPIATPSVENELPSSGGFAEAVMQRLPLNLPSATQMIENYIKALGAAAAIEAVTSRAEKGTEIFHGQTVKVEILTQAPGKQAFLRHLSAGESETVFDGKEGWFVFPGRPAREMSGADLDAARMDADLQLPLHIRELFPELRVEYPEMVNGRAAHLLLGIREGQPPMKLYFDEQSNLLVRVVRYAESPLGRNPTQTDYADYRGVNGVQVPFRVTISQPGDSSRIQLETVQTNVQIDGGRFAKPPLNRVHAASNTTNPLK